MRIRVKYRSQRLVVDVTGSGNNLTVADVIRCASAAFNLESDAISVSLNGEVFLRADEGGLDTSEWGLVPGDLIHIQNESEVNPQPMELENETKSISEPELLSQSSTVSEYYSISNSQLSLSLELTESFPRNLQSLVRIFEPQTACQYVALACHALFTDAGFLTPSDEMFEPRWSCDTAVIRLSYHYKGPQIPTPEKAPVMVTVMDCDQFVSISAQVAMDGGPSSYFSTALQACKFVERSSESDRLRLINHTELVTRIRDDLLEKLRQDLHSYFGLMPLGLLRLPNELQFKILRHLDCKSLCHMERVCSLYRHLARAIWRRLFQRDFQGDYERLRNAGVSDWKMVYQESYERAKAMAEARRQSIERVETFIFHNDWPPDILPLPLAPLRPPMRPPGPGMLGGPHDLWPGPLMPRGPMPGPLMPRGPMPGPLMPPFRPFRYPRS